MTADNPHVRRCPRCLRPGFQGPEGRDRTSLETFTQTHHLQPGDGLLEPLRTTIANPLGAFLLGVLPGDQVLLQNIFFPAEGMDVTHQLGANALRGLVELPRLRNNLIHHRGGRTHEIETDLGSGVLPLGPHQMKEHRQPKRLALVLPNIAEMTDGVEGLSAST